MFKYTLFNTQSFEIIPYYLYLPDESEFKKVIKSRKGKNAYKEKLVHIYKTLLGTLYEESLSAK